MHRKKYPFIAGFLVLPVGLYLLLVVWPYIQTISYSFTDWSGASQKFDFIGFDNYRDLAKDDVFIKALQHNALLLILVPTLTILLSLFFAFMVNVGGRGGAGGVSGVKGSGFYRIIFFFPQVLSVAILAILFKAVYRGDDSGLINGTLQAVGLGDKNHPTEWLNDPDLVLWCIVFVMIWAGAGFYMVLFSAAMQSIPRDIYEAALLDGAGRFQTFFRVTLPLLWETIQTAWVFLAILAMDAFLLISTLTSQDFGGGPDHSSEVISTYLMRNFQTYSKSGYACAMGVVMLLLTLIVSIVTLRLSRRDRIEY
ncbi:sugar ABC transporter permease [Streptomyces longispororuber]|uniref:Sugar ABC transporter permease n=1 Tax=Streptomyces longispororuber TaxID=68230 RepID=A0A919ABY9_9ACTN|nr:sugar ABC transporter permease [Streptomyces longispororuber]GHE98992.1 sugar ABC transporter permease [Streptomyces longispororuber]